MILEQRAEEGFFGHIAKGYRAQVKALSQDEFYFSRNMAEDIGSAAAVLFNLYSAVRSTIKDVTRVYRSIRR